MDLLTYISDIGRRKALAFQCGTSPEYLWQIANRWRGRQASVDLARKIETESGGDVTRYDLRPDIFGPAQDKTEAA